MVGVASRLARMQEPAAPPFAAATADPPWIRRLLIGTTLAFLGLLLLAPLVLVFRQAFADGWIRFGATLGERETLSAIKLTLLVALIAVPINVVFGLCAAWAIGKFQFRGRTLLLTLIDLPFAISPVIAGLILVLVFGRHGWLGPWLEGEGVRVIFAVPGIVLATMFVTFPFVVREVIPVMETQGSGEEEVARLMGASGLQIFRSITLPNVRWGLLYGAILCNARAMGEFGAVSVVSGHIRGLTTTLPLHVEILYNEYEYSAAFASASLLTLLALLTLLLKSFVEWRSSRASSS